MKRILVIVLCFSVVYFPFVRGTCNWNFRLVSINDTTISKEIFSYEADESFEFTSWAVTQADGGLDFSNALTYFQYTIIDNNFSVQTTEDFGNLNSDAYTDGKDLLTINLVIKLKCGSSSTDSSLLISVQNTNQNAPEFSQASYTYLLPMPIMPKTDFSLYGNEMISATDIDFSTSQISFSIDPNDFAITSIKTGSKTFQAVFSANKILRFDETQLYTLTAKDSGSSAKSTSVQITLNVDPTAGFDSPSFSSSYYSYNYTGGSTPSLIQTGAVIAVQSDKANYATYALSGDHSSLFILDFKNSSNTFTLTLTSGATWPEDVLSPIVLTITFTTDVTINAVTLITLVNDVTLPLFSSDYYVGTYDIDANKISWTESIKISDSSSVKVSGDKSSLFTLNPTTFELTPITSLAKSDFDDNLNLFLTLTASSSAGEVRATVVISLLTPDVLKFDSAYYYGSYSIENKKGIVSLDANIEFLDVTEFTGIVIEVDNSYKDNFKIELDPSKWKVTVQQELDTTVLNTNSELAIPITATKTGESVKSTAILILKLPEKVEINFSSSYYTANYVIGSETELDSVVLDSDIMIEGTDTSDIVVTAAGYSDNFVITYNVDKSTYEVIVKNNLNSTVLDTETEIVITLKASKTDGSAGSTTVLILKLQEKLPSLNFENKHYAAEYIMDTASKASVQVTSDIIKITGTSSSKIDFTFEGYDDNFEMVYDSASSLCTINVKNNLNSSIFSSETQLIITINAADTDTSSTASTVLVLALPDTKSSLKFESKYYIAEYTVDSTSNGSVKLTDASIEISSEGSDKIVFTFEGYNDNFEMLHDLDSSTYTINVKSNLNSSILDSETQLIIAITAVETDTSSTAGTVLVLNLPNKTSSFNFENNYYSAEYILDSTSKAVVKLTDDRIKVTGTDAKHLEFTFEGYNDNFEMAYDSASFSYTINVKTNLNSSIITSTTQLIVTITAVDTDSGSASDTVLVLVLPDKLSSLDFENKHYAAEYIIDPNSQGTVKFTDDSIKLTGADSDKIEFIFEGYNANFDMERDSASSTFNIKVKTNLNDSTLASEKQLVITITAVDTDTLYTASTVLVLVLPDKTPSPNFEKQHYAAEYIVDSTSKASVKITEDQIKLTSSSSNIEFTFEGYNNNFEMAFNSASFTYEINVKSNLNSTILTSETQLVITITAADKDTDSTASTILILSLPGSSSSLHFEKKYYEAEYFIDSSSHASVELMDDDIKINGVDSSDIEFLFEDYSKNFEIIYDSVSSAYKINVIANLNSSVLNLYKELIIPITASITDATDTTVLVLKLPETLIKFEEQYYTAEYIVLSKSEGSVQLNKNISITDDNSLQLQFSFQGYEENFGLEFDSTTSVYNVIVKKALEESILSSNPQLIITIMATSDDLSTFSASTVLVLNLPSSINPIEVFETDYYVATYVQSTTTENDQLQIITEVKLKNSEFAESNLIFEGYDDNFLGTCDSSTLLCTITVQKNLNATILNLNTELLITLTASKKDGSNTGKTVLLVKLPSETSTFTFSKTHYYGIYTIEKLDDGNAIVKLNDTISFNGAEPSEITIVADEYSDEFKFSFDTNWNIIVKNNLGPEILSARTELVTSLTATKTSKTDNSKATLVIKLPDKTTIAFSNPQYSGEYIIDDSGKASVVLMDSSEIQTTDDDAQITLDSYPENFKVTIGSNSKWSIAIVTPLDASIFTENKQLKLLMTLTKVGVKYGEAALLIKLPEPRFTEGFYTATYSDEAGASITGEDINVVNVEVSNIQVNLSKYNEYIYIELQDGKWVVKLGQPLLANLTQNNEPLLTDLNAIRKSDNSQLATSTLIVKLPDLNSPDIPKFTQFTFYGDYKNSSETSSVELKDFIGFTNLDIVTPSNVYIEEESSQYATNFKIVSRDDGTYNVEVTKNLDPDVLETKTSIVVTLVASTKEGNKNYAALVITLPKLPRETSLQFEDEQILFSGTYENGTFTSKSITIETNSTDDNQISVDITNDLELDNKYFSYTYKNKVLSLKVDNLPDDILEKHAVIPLKLAIRDKSTGDTIYAVLNVNVNYKSDNDDDGGHDSTDGSRLGLLIAVIILALLLIAVIVAVVLLWYFKIRNTKYVKMEEENVMQSTKPTFTKNLNRQMSNSAPSNSALRRPTGIPIGIISPESPAEEISNDLEVSSVPELALDNEKKVAFDDTVRDIDEHKVDYEEPNENLQNVADRRPTQFVFAYPMEAVLDGPAERRESSDYIGFDPEKKKSVVFDENVERMDIDVDDHEDNDENETDDEEHTTVDVNTDDEKTNFKTDLEVMLEQRLKNELSEETV